MRCPIASLRWRDQMLWVAFENKCSHVLLVADFSDLSYVGYFRRTCRFEHGNGRLRILLQIKELFCKSNTCLEERTAAFVGCVSLFWGVEALAIPMTCHSSDSSETIENNRRSETESRAVETEQSRVASAMRDLKNTGWYWGRLTANEAKEILQDSPEGTFLVRDSSQRDYLFTISAMTSAGPTNLRIEYKDGKFKLDSVVLVKPKLKQFDSVVHLVEHYVKLSRTSCRAGSAQSPGSGSALAPLGPNSNGTVQLLLTKPAYAAMPCLQHLCRITINKTTRQVRDLPLPNRLKDYLTDYTYHV